MNHRWKNTAFIYGFYLLGYLQINLISQPANKEPDSKELHTIKKILRTGISIKISNYQKLITLEYVLHDF